MPEYTSMMEVILEIADDDQDLPVDDQLVRIRAFLPNQAFEHLSLWPPFFIVPILYSSSQVEEAEQLLSFAIGLQVQVQDDKQGKSGTSCRQENQDFKQSGKGFEKEIIRGDGGFLFNQEANADKKTEKVKVDQEKENEIVSKREDMMTKENFKKKDMLLSRGPII